MRSSAASDVYKETVADLLDDPERRARMGRAGRQRAQELFSWQAVARATAAAYERVIADFEHEGAR
jgi:glycosyltransferase involved in cell wall biosynthesis